MPSDLPKGLSIKRLFPIIALVLGCSGAGPTEDGPAPPKFDVAGVYDILHAANDSLICGPPSGGCQSRQVAAYVDTTNFFIGDCTLRVGVRGQVELTRSGAFTIIYEEARRCIINGGEINVFGLVSVGGNYSAQGPLLDTVLFQTVFNIFDVNVIRGVVSGEQGRATTAGGIVTIIPEFIEVDIEGNRGPFTLTYRR